MLKAGSTPTLLILWRLANALECEILLRPGRSAKLVPQAPDTPLDADAPGRAKATS